MRCKQCYGEGVGVLRDDMHGVPSKNVAAFVISLAKCLGCSRNKGIVQVGAGVMAAGCGL